MQTNYTLKHVDSYRIQPYLFGFPLQTPSHYDVIRNDLIQGNAPKKSPFKERNVGVIEFQIVVLKLLETVPGTSWKNQLVNCLLNYWSSFFKILIGTASIKVLGRVYNVTKFTKSGQRFQNTQVNRE